MKKIIMWFKGLFQHKPGKNAKLGWKRDLPDARDYKFKVSAPMTLPEKVDLRDKCPVIYDQGNIGSCTANSMGGVFQFEQIKQEIPNFIPSRLFIYYNTRAMEGTINSDAGATLRNTIKTMADNGACPEKMWPYHKCFKKKPTDDCYAEGLKNQVIEYLRVDHNLYNIRVCLAEGHPISFGMMLFESFMSDYVTNTGIVPMPDLSKEGSIGGHAVMLVGYDDTKQQFIVRNSWGTGWGDNGYFYLPYQYVNTANLTADYWTIRLVETPVTEQVVEETVPEQVVVTKTRRPRKNKK